MRAGARSEVSFALEIIALKALPVLTRVHSRNTGRMGP